MTKSNSGPLSPIPLVPLLITESEEEYHRIRQGFYDEIGPVGIIEQMYVDDLIDIVWEIVRLKRCKVGVTNMAFHGASVSVLQRFLQAGPDLAYEWISDPKVAKVVEDELAKYKLDGSVVIAGAIRDSTYALERIELLLATAERRRDVILQRIYHYRSEMSSVLRRASDRLIESAVVESWVAEAAVESAVVDSAVIESAVAESVVAETAVAETAVVAIKRPVAKMKSRRRFRSDGTIIRLASAAAKTADHVGDDGGGNTADGGAGAGLPPARKGTAA
jgi:hypothetical protein